MLTIEHKLDDPVLNSLNELDRSFSMENDELKFYNPEYCPFASLIQNNENKKVALEASNCLDNFYVFGEKPLIGNGLIIGSNLRSHQMLLNERIDLSIENTIIELKSKKQKAELLSLVNSILPTLFKNKSADLGKFYGIYREGQLISVIGERMKMNEYTEISSVVTHSDHTRMGYAKQLLKFLTDKIFDDFKIPYLHVVETNLSAIKLYEKLGFTTRRKLDCWNIRQVN